MIRAAEAIISGSASRPFPLLLNLDYNRCRGEAWLAALENAARLLPPGALHALGNLAPLLPNARFALCALLFPVDVVTPELSAGSEIKVYLQDSGKNAAAFADPARLLVMGLLIAETRELLRQISTAWPERIVPGEIDLSLLERLSGKLAALWTLAENPDSEKLAEAGRLFPDSLAIALARAEKPLQTDNAEAGENPLEQFQAALAKNEAGLSPDLRELLESYLLYLKGRWNLRANQYAMAERQFGKLAENPLFMEIFSRRAMDALLEHAAFMKRKGKLAEMCGDLFSICSLGDCHPLLEARLRGLCASGEK